MNKVRPAGQVSGPSPWVILTAIGLGLIGVTALQYALHKAK